MANANVDENEDGLADIGEVAIVLVDGAGFACPEEEAIQEDNNAEEGQRKPVEDNQLNDRPQREQRPPDWFVDYQMNF